MAAVRPAESIAWRRGQSVLVHRQSADPGKRWRQRLARHKSWVIKTGGCACGPAETSSALDPVVEPRKHDLQYAFAANVIQELVIAAVLDQ